MLKEKRSCPECEHGVVIVKELVNGSQCSYCRKLIELNFTFVAGIPIVLVVLLTFFLQYDMYELGYFCAFLVIVFTAGEKEVFSSFLPLKFYGDS